MMERLERVVFCMFKRELNYWLLSAILPFIAYYFLFGFDFQGTMEVNNHDSYYVISGFHLFTSSIILSIGFNAIFYFLIFLGTRFPQPKILFQILHLLFLFLVIFLFYLFLPMGKPFGDFHWNLQLWAIVLLGGIFLLGITRLIFNKK